MVNLEGINVQWTMVNDQWSVDSAPEFPVAIDQGIDQWSFSKEEGRMANQVGKRYICKKCGVEFIVTRGGNGTIRCCGEPMELKK